MTPIQYSDLRNGTNNIIIHLYRAPASMTIDELLNPNLWANVVSKLDKEDIISVIWEDFSKECELRVVSKQDKIVRLKLRGNVIYYEDEQIAETKQGYRVEWRGKGRFCIFKEGIAEAIVKNIDTKEQALEQLAKLAA